MPKSKGGRGINPKGAKVPPDSPEIHVNPARNQNPTYGIWGVGSICTKVATTKTLGALHKQQICKPKYVVLKPESSTPSQICTLHATNCTICSCMLARSADTSEESQEA